MSNLISNAFKNKNTFKKAFDELEILQAELDNSRTKKILTYLTRCTKAIVFESAETYPEQELKYINPVFIQDKIYLTFDHIDKKDNNILKATHVFFELYKNGVISSISNLVIENNIPGICFYANTKNLQLNYEQFKSFDLDHIQSTIELIDGEVHEQFLIEDITNYAVNEKDFTEEFLNFAHDLNVVEEKEKN